jgi:hypothetical protein
MGPAERAPGKVEARVQYDFIFRQLPRVTLQHAPFSMLKHALGVSSCLFWYVGGDFDVVTPWGRSHDVDMGWWRRILSRLSWVDIVGPGSFLSDPLSGDLVVRPISQ